MKKHKTRARMSCGEEVKTDEHVFLTSSSDFLFGRQPRLIAVPFRVRLSLNSMTL